MRKTVKEKRKLRIAVAKDVIASLNILKIKAGSFVETSRLPIVKIIIEQSIKTSRQQAEQLKKYCTVCALGACMLSLVSIDNKFDFKKGLEYDNWDNKYAIDDAKMFSRLLEIFNKKQIYLIENAFEKGKGWFDFWCTSDTKPYMLTIIENSRWQNDREKAIKFGKKLSRKEALRAIMQNIIDNKGEFIP